MALTLIITLLSFTGTMSSDITHCDGLFSNNNTCSQTCLQLPCTMRCDVSNSKHDKCEQNCVTSTCDLVECEASESCEQTCVGRTCNSMVCHADSCSQECTAGQCDMICSSSVKDCQQTCIAGNCNYKCDAKNCKLDCFPGTCSELKSSTGRYLCLSVLILGAILTVLNCEPQSFTFRGRISRFGTCASYKASSFDSMVYETIKTKLVTLAGIFPLQFSL